MKKGFFILTFTLMIVSCAPKSDSIKVQEIDPKARHESSGLGIESRDIALMSEKMVADIFEADFYGEIDKTPSIVIEGEKFVNESNSIINMNLLVDRLRINLIRKAKRQINFLTRENLNLLIEESKVSGSDFEITEADFRLVGRLSSISSVSNKSGIKSNFFQFSFEILDLGSGSLVWADIYEIKKVGADDTIYR